mmetsp:Transcript_23580/g.50156  ORF Transcript_23580/g.50156 Transcript_23580/m.50156 type:complete len:297 (-) Transcript_23580:161-1051(-)
MILVVPCKTFLTFGKGPMMLMTSRISILFFPRQFIKTSCIRARGTLWRPVPRWQMASSLPTQARRKSDLSRADNSRRRSLLLFEGISSNSSTTARMSRTLPVRSPRTSSSLSRTILISAARSSSTTFWTLCFCRRSRFGARRLLLVSSCTTPASASPDCSKNAARSGDIADAASDLMLLLLPPLFFFREVPAFRCCLVERLGVMAVLAVPPPSVSSSSMLPRVPRFMTLLPYNCVESPLFVLGTTANPSASAMTHEAAIAVRTPDSATMSVLLFLFVQNKWILVLALRRNVLLVAK